MTTIVARTVEFRGFGAIAGIAGLLAAAVPVASAAIPAATRAPIAAQAEGASKYGGLMPLVRAHREDQVKMVKLWQSMKAGDVSEKTRDAYKAAQIAAQFARERHVPYFGICFGMQMACIEAARNLCGITQANSTEFGPTTEPVVGLMTEWEKGNELEKRNAAGDLGGTMRLGAYAATLSRGSRVAQIYGMTDISERHRHRYEVNTGYKARLEQHGLRFSGMSPDGILPEIVEYDDHPWFIGVQFHPELKSRPFEPHPLFSSFIGAAVDQSRR